MKRWMGLICAAALLLCAFAGAEATLPTTAPAAETFFGAEDAAAGRELTGYFGGDIARAAEEIGGMEFSAGEEFEANYDGVGVALHGNGGVVTFIDLRPEDVGDTLCGIDNGMSREDAQLLMNGCPMLWDYPEELAWTVREDPKDELNNETLVVFFDEDGKVCGAWYRTSGE